MTPRPGARRHARQLRRRTEYVVRLAEAATPMQRVAAAQDYLRAVLADTPADHADKVAVEVVASLEAVADRLERAYPRHPAVTR
jgi:hypothetical protein